MDYIATTAASASVTFLPSVAGDLDQRRMCANITIRNDLLLESLESFNLSLVLAEGDRVELSPNETEIFIVDDDSKSKSRVLICFWGSWDCSTLFCL